jgi:hypothetical protein
VLVGRLDDRDVGAHGSFRSRLIGAHDGINDQGVLGM